MKRLKIAMFPVQICTIMSSINSFNLSSIINTQKPRQECNIPPKPNLYLFHLPDSNLFPPL